MIKAYFLGDICMNCIFHAAVIGRNEQLLSVQSYRMFTILYVCKFDMCQMQASYQMSSFLSVVFVKEQQLKHLMHIFKI